MTKEVIHSLIHEMNKSRTTIFRCLKDKVERNDAILMEDLIHQNIAKFEKNFLDLSKIVILNKSTKEWLMERITSLKNIDSYSYDIEESEEDFTRIVSFLREHSKAYSN